MLYLRKILSLMAVGCSLSQFRTADVMTCLVRHKNQIAWHGHRARRVQVIDPHRLADQKGGGG